MIHDPVLVNDWHVVAPLSALGATGIITARLLDEPIVIWRTGARLMAWQDLCLHRGTRLSLGEIQGDCLMCPYHGWTYDVNGQCVAMPAHPDQQPSPKARVQTYHVQTKYDLIWVCPGQPQHAIPAFPEYDDAQFRNVLCGPYRFQAAGTRVVENFLDVGHFPFVHEHILGVRERPEIADYDVVTDDAGITASGITVWQPDPDGSGIGRDVTYTYRVYRPLIAYLSKDMAEAGFAILLMVTPVSELESLAWMWMEIDASSDAPEDELRAFQDTIALQDVPIVESQRPERLPLDLQAELHLRSDKTAIAYRRWLNTLGLSFGTT